MKFRFGLLIQYLFSASIFLLIYKLFNIEITNSVLVVVVALFAHQMLRDIYDKIDSIYDKIDKDNKSKEDSVK